MGTLLYINRKNMKEEKERKGRGGEMEGSTRVRGKGTQLKF